MFPLVQPAIFLTIPVTRLIVNNSESTVEAIVIVTSADDMGGGSVRGSRETGARPHRREPEEPKLSISHFAILFRAYAE